MSVGYQIGEQKRGAGHFLAVLIAGAAGVASAMIADFVQKGEASTILVMDSLVNRLLQVELPPSYIVLGLLIAGSLSVYIFEPRNKRSAFYTGASILAVLMTSMPVKELEKLAPALEMLVPPDEASLGAMPDYATLPQQVNCAYGGAGNAMVISASMRSAPSQVNCFSGNGAMQAPVIQVQATDRIGVLVNVKVPNGNSKVPSLAVYLYDEASGKKWNLTSIGKARHLPGSKGYLVTYKTSIPRSQNSRLFVRVEAEGYAIARTNVAAKGVAVKIPLELKKSNTALWLQRLNTPMKF